MWTPRRRRPKVDPPTEITVFLKDGTRVECLIEQIGEFEWQGVPVTDVEINDVDHAYIDVIPPGGAVSVQLGELVEYE